MQTTTQDDPAQRHRLERVEALWGGPPPLAEAEQWARYPMSHPIVRAAVNRRASGDPAHSPYHRLAAFLDERGFTLPLRRTASICCGTGWLEHRLVKLGVIESCTGFDLAEGALAQARQGAAAAGYDELIYERRDFEREGLGLSNLNLVLAHQGIHHIEGLEAVFDAVHAALAPWGIFHLHEFVGADRFQWPERQIAEMTAWLQSLPRRYRLTAAGHDKGSAGRATVEEMIQHDPSEAVRSSAIEPLLAERFEIIERRPLGGTLVMMALADIGHNFDPRKPEDVGHLDRLLAREDALIAAGELGSDFVAIAAGRRAPN